MKPSRLAPALLLVWSAGVVLSAQRQSDVIPELQPQDFAYGLTLAVPSGEPFARFDLPADVLSSTAWPDLRDLRIFNAAGQTVPFARIQQPTSASTRRRVPLQSFRLESMKPGTMPVIQLDARARGVELRVAPGATPEAGTEYMLAVSDTTLKTPIERLYFEWQQEPTNWQQRITVSVSNDLDDWRTVAFARPLMDLKTDDGQRLQHAEVVVARSASANARYWRLRFGPGFAPTLTGVEGEITTAAPPPAGVELTTAGRLEPGGAAVYELVARQPVARLRITPQDVNSVLPLIVEGRDQNEEPWQPLTRTVAYRLNQDGQEVFSDPIDLGGQMLKSIRLRALQSSLGSSIPSIHIEREPVTIVLNARGAGPFLLAWGARAAADGTVPVAMLVPNLSVGGLVDFPAAREVSRVSLGGPSRLTALAPAERTARWHAVLMWVILVGGAGALALLAFKVYRESKTRQEDPQ